MFADSLTEDNLQKWDKLFGARAWGQYPSEELIRFVARNFFKVSDRRAVRILEIGCGPGANIWFMAREGYSASAIDGSATAIKQLTARLVRENIVYDPNEFK